MVFLKNFLNADWRDILQMPVGSKSKKLPVQRESMRKMREMLWPDYMLYFHFYAKMLRMIKERGELFRQKRSAYETMYAALNVTCQAKVEEQMRAEMYKSLEEGSTRYVDPCWGMRKAGAIFRYYMLDKTKAAGK